MISKEDRKRGYYPTPPDLVELAHEYLKPDIVEKETVWWDPCAGEGALLSGCTDGSTVFATDLIDPGIWSSCEFDFLNDDMIPHRISDLFSEDLRWVFIMNPPFSQGTGGQYVPKGDGARRGLSDTMVGKRMKVERMGLSMRNTACQFIYRIENLIREHSLDAIIALFCPTGILSGPGYSSFRRFWFEDSHLVRGFCFNSKRFDNVSAEWPMMFGVWGRGGEDLPPEFDVLEEDIPEGYSSRKIFSCPSLPFSSIPIRPKATVIRPPMIVPLAVAEKGVDKQSKDAIASIYSDGNDVRHSFSSCYITTGPNAHTGSWSITPDNFDDTMFLFSVRRLVKPNWLNWQDQFSCPDGPEDEIEEFKWDAIAWSLFERKNMTSSVKLSYKGEDFDLRNQFFWGELEGKRQSNSSDFIQDDIDENGMCETFVHRWIGDHIDRISLDIQDVISMFSKFTSETFRFRHLCDPSYQLHRWDAGLFQIRRGMLDIKESLPEHVLQILCDFDHMHSSVAERLRPKIRRFGIL